MTINIGTSFGLQGTASILLNTQEFLGSVVGEGCRWFVRVCFKNDKIQYLWPQWQRSKRQSVVIKKDSTKFTRPSRALFVIDSRSGAHEECVICSSRIQDIWRRTDCGICGKISSSRNQWCWRYLSKMLLGYLGDVFQQRIRNLLGTTVEKTSKNSDELENFFDTKLDKMFMINLEKTCLTKGSLWMVRQWVVSIAMWELELLTQRRRKK
jgi:hypothetical protein